jgi:hypothetical protein
MEIFLWVILRAVLTVNVSKVLLLSPSWFILMRTSLQISVLRVMSMNLLIWAETMNSASTSWRLLVSPLLMIVYQAVILLQLLYKHNV